MPLKQSLKRTRVAASAADTPTGTQSDGSSAHVVTDRSNRPAKIARTNTDNSLHKRSLQEAIDRQARAKAELKQLEKSRQEIKTALIRNTPHNRFSESLNNIKFFQGDKCTGNFTYDQSMLQKTDLAVYRLNVERYRVLLLQEKLSANPNAFLIRQYEDCGVAAENRLQAEEKKQAAETAATPSVAPNTSLQNRM